MMPGPAEIAIVLGIGIVLFGHKRLGELGTSFGKALGNFKKGYTRATKEKKREAEDSVDRSNTVSLIENTDSET